MMWPPNALQASRKKHVFFNRVQIANAATELHRNVLAYGFQNGFDRQVVLGFASEGAVQVHQVQTPCAFSHPVQRHLRGVFAKRRCLVHVALFQAYAMSVFEVNRRNK